MLPAAVDSGRMASKRGVVRLVSLSCFRGSALRRAAAEAAATAAGVPGNHSSPSRSSSSTILMQLGDLPTPELGCTTENMSCRKIVAWMPLAIYQLVHSLHGGRNRCCSVLQCERMYSRKIWKRNIAKKKWFRSA